MRDGVDVWRALGVPDPEAISMLTAEETTSLAEAAS
jgi:hypothetical protein